jgi:hypothetical protein
MKIAETLNRTLFLVFVLLLLDISVKLLLKQSLHNHTHLFIKAHTKTRIFFNTEAGGGGKCPRSNLVPRLFPLQRAWVRGCPRSSLRAPTPTKSHFATSPPQEKSRFPKFIQTNQQRITNR